MILLGVVLLAPWLQGGTSATQQVYLFATVLVALTVSVLPLVLEPSRRHPLPALLLVVLGGAGLGVWQLLPISHRGADSAIETLRAEFGQYDAQAVASQAEPAEASPLTLSTAATRRDVSLLVVAASLVALGALLFSRTASLQLALVAVAANGVLLALFEMWQKATWNGLLMWHYPLPKTATPFGPFFYHNQAAGYLSICLAAAIAWLLLVRRRLWKKFSDGNLANPLGLFEVVLTHWAVIASSIVILCIALLATLSRGGVLATIGGAACAWMIASRSRRSSLQFGSLVVITVASLGVLGWLAMSDKVSRRMETLVDQKTMTQETRLPLWQDSWSLIKDQFPWGTGLGTFRYAYFKYHSHDSELWYTHTHNQYLETLADGGLPAIALLLGAVLLMVWALARLKWLGDPREEPFLILGAFVLTAQLLHAVVDFIPYLVPNMMLFALICGAVTGRATLRIASGLSGQLLGWRIPGWSNALVVLVLLSACGWSWRETRDVALMERTRSELPWKGQAAEALPSKLREGIDAFNLALETRPDDAESHEAVAELWITLYRVRARESLIQELGFAPNDANVWNFTDPILLHHLSQQHAKSNDQAALAELRTEKTIADNLGPALEHLHLARKACPMLAQTHLRLAELCFLDDSPGQDLVHLDRALKLAGSKPDVLVQIGRAEFSADRHERAYAAWRRCLRVTERYDQDILEFARQGMSAEEIVEKLLPPSPLRILAFVRVNYSQPDVDQEARDRLLSFAMQLAKDQEIDPGDRSYLEASSAAMQGSAGEAIEQYKKAVFQRPEKISWRFELAQLLASSGDLEAARREARWCLRARPRSREYRQFLESLHNTSRIRQGRYNQQQGLQSAN